MNTNAVRFFTHAILLPALIPLLLSCAATSLPQATETPRASSPAPTTSAVPSGTVSTTPTLLTPPPLGMVPQNCPPGPTPQPIFSDIGPVVGAAPLWVTGFGGPHAVIHIPTYFTFTQYGWTWKLLWKMQSGYTHPITLEGGNLRNGTLLWFQIGQQNPSTSPVLDLLHSGQQPGAGSGLNWPSYVYIPTAGCYYLEAKWPGGHWRIIFAAGRQ